MPTVMITGCSSGIGLESALAFARRGDRVFACVRDIDRAQELKRRSRVEQLNIELRVLDVTASDTFEREIGEILKESGCIDVLVNNAGILSPGAWEDLTEAQTRTVMETNFFGPMLLTRAVLPSMRENKSGTIIMISSLSGQAGIAGDVAYAGSKFALEGASEALRYEVERWGIQVALVEAGHCTTNLFGSAGMPIDYPKDSPYKALVQHRITQAHRKTESTLSPVEVAKLLPIIAESDGSQLRWPADDRTYRIQQTLQGQSDSERSEFLREAGDSRWWSAGLETPGSKI